jgi:hypothetical protein
VRRTVADDDREALVVRGQAEERARAAATCGLISTTVMRVRAGARARSARSTAAEPNISRSSGAGSNRRNAIIARVRGPSSPGFDSRIAL